ncbi:uncharacterized protein N7500_005256 [Penicillium coprophilum]|uniref:uncharacterized protein n=1 Tax=Penicillium coprophilum TaxID=36646 RepID=UPI00238B3558|nr:uncharacterized protein N7500_005256 [Penicillium coprophilum]KAJ5163426.1 hypothetical protein N7500_005256 [Penicillium coprophilum]
MHHGVLNDEASPRCLIVQPDPANDLDSEYKYKMTMIDFGHTTVRTQYSPREDWRWREAHSDTEEAVGQVMRRALEVDYGGGYVYTRTPYRQALQNGYMKEGDYKDRDERPMLSNV